MTDENESQYLYWPSFSATQTRLAEILKEKGFTVTHEGRSGFESRNSYVVSTPDGCLSKENLEKIHLGIQEAEDMLDKEKEQAFDQYFDECSIDKNKCYAIVETGCNYDLIRKPSDNYVALASTIIAYTQDLRQGREHTYATFMVNDERMKHDSRSSITFVVPKKLIGQIIGKGGAHIKELQARYKKHFKVVQEPKEIIKEKKEAIKTTLQELLKEQDFDQIRKHMGEIVNLESMFSVADKKEMIASIEDGITREKERIKEKERRARSEQILGLSHKIAENIGPDYLFLDRTGLDRQTDNYIKESKEAEELGLNSQEIIELKQDLRAKQKEEKSIIKEESRRYLDQDIEDKTDEEIKANLKEHMDCFLNWKGMSHLLPATLKIGEEQLALKRQKEYEHQLELERQQKLEEEKQRLEAEKQKRIEAVDKKFDKVVRGELERFYNDKNNIHGADFFQIVGKDRRRDAKEAIILSTFKKLDPEHYKEDFCIVYSYDDREELRRYWSSDFDRRLDDIICGADENEQNLFIVREAEPTEDMEEIEFKPQTKEDSKKARKEAKKDSGGVLPKCLLDKLLSKYNGK